MSERIRMVSLDVFSLALRALAVTHKGRDLQQALADHLGVRQQSISSVSA